ARGRQSPINRQDLVCNAPRSRAGHIAVASQRSRSGWALEGAYGAYHLAAQLDSAASIGVHPHPDELPPTLFGVLDQDLPGGITCRATRQTQYEVGVLEHWPYSAPSRGPHGERVILFRGTGLPSANVDRLRGGT